MPLAFIIEPTSDPAHFNWIVFNRYTGFEARFGGAATRTDAETAARAAIADLLK
jgi:hypothetical protein